MQTVDVAQLVRALVCGTRGRGFEPHLPPKKSLINFDRAFLFPNFLEFKYLSHYFIWKYNDAFVTIFTYGRNTEVKVVNNDTL